MSFANINKRYLIAIILLVIAGGLLEFYYVSFVCENYAHSGFILDFSFAKYLESKIWYCVLIFFSIVVYKRSSFIGSLFLFLFFLIYIPGHIVYSYSNGNQGLFYSTIAFFTIVAIIAPLKIQLFTLKVSDNFTYYLLLIFAFILFIPVFNDFRLSISSEVLKLNDIYEVRSVFKSNISFVSSYTFWWLAKVVLPVILVYSLLKKNRKFVIFSLIIIVYLFLISGHKSVYFTPILILFYYYVGKDYNDKIMYTMIFMLILFIGVNIPDLIVGRPVFKSIFIRRMFFVPSLINECYFDFFNGRPIYLSHSFLGSLSDYPYDVAPEYLIARQYFNKPEMSANTGIIANAFMNFGYWGILIYSFLFSTFLAILNSVNLNRRYFGLFIFFMFIFRGSPFFTTILTHGFWIVLILAFTVLPQRKSAET